MPTLPYQMSYTFTRDALRRAPTARARANALGDFLPSDLDYQALLNQVPQTLIQLYQAGRQSEVQDKLLELNIARAQRGQSPISLEQIGGMSLVAPQAGVSVNLSPETKQALMIGAGVLAVALLAKRAKK